MVSMEFFIDIILPGKLWPGVDSSSKRNEYQEYSLGGKGSWCIGLTVLKFGNFNILESSGPVQACNGIASPLYSLRLHRKFFVTTPSAEMTDGVYTYIVKLPVIFYFQGQVFVFCNFLCFSFGKVLGQGNC